MKKQKLVVSIIGLLLCAFFSSQQPVYAFGPESAIIYSGIDVSGWQENIDYAAVKEAGIEIVYMKASQGSNFVDPYFERNYTEAKANNLKVGFYHYVTARTTEEAVVEANFFASVIGGKTPDARLAMDFESFGNLNREEINAIALTFLRTVESLTKKEMVVYSNTNDATNIFYGEVTTYPLWVAQYEVEQPTPNGNWNTWIGWQYTDEGRVNGIENHVDRDRFTQQILLTDTTTLPPVEKPTNPTSPSGTTSIIIQRGDTLSQIAKDYQTTVAELVRLNNIANPNLIYVGERLIVPQNTSINANGSERIYIVKKGDTLSKIANQYHTSVVAIAQYNGIRNVNRIYIGQRIKIPTAVQEKDMSHTIYEVRRGDTLWSISRRYGVSIASIVRKNRIMNPNLIYVGERLRIG